MKEDSKSLSISIVVPKAQHSGLHMKARRLGVPLGTIGRMLLFSWLDGRLHLGDYLDEEEPKPLISPASSDETA